MSQSPRADCCSFTGQCRPQPQEALAVLALLGQASGPQGMERHPLPTRAYPAAAQHAQAQGPVRPRATGHTPGPILETVPTPHDEAFAKGPAHVSAQGVPWEGRATGSADAGWQGAGSREGPAQCGLPASPPCAAGSYPLLRRSAQPRGKTSREPRSTLCPLQQLRVPPAACAGRHTLISTVQVGKPRRTDDLLQAELGQLPGLLLRGLSLLSTARA